MKVVIFAGGLGTRIAEESHLRPKPMIEIGGKPILWHIMKMYESYGFKEFVICLGYKSYVIKEYFIHYYLHNSDISIDLKSNQIDILHNSSEDIKVTLVETGNETKTAGRLKRVQQYIGNETFMLTYGDGVSDIDLEKLLSHHKAHGKIATVTSVLPEGKFGAIISNPDNSVTHFMEKPKGDGHWINGGFFVLEPEVFRFLPGNMDNVMWEDAPLQQLTEENQLVSYKHHGFWKCMDALRDKLELDKIWENRDAKWKRW